ncbi:MAG: TonB family protein [bacterium]
MKKILVLAYLVLAVSYATLIAKDSVCTHFNVTYNLFDKYNRPINKDIDLTIKLYDCDKGGTALWTEVHKNVPIEYGYFSIDLGKQTPLTFKLIDDKYWVEVIANDSIYNRFKYKCNPYTFESIHNSSMRAEYFKNKEDLTVASKKKNSKDSIPNKDGCFYLEDFPRMDDYGKFMKSVVYPEEAKMKGIEGKVILAIFIDPFGNPSKATILDSPDSLLNQAAINAVMNYKGFIPASKENHPNGCWLQIPINFKIKELTEIEYNDNELRSNIKYTTKSLKLLEEGTVYAKVTVDSNGIKTKVESILSNNILLEEIAFNAINATEFIPAKVGNKKINRTIGVLVRIALPEKNININFDRRNLIFQFANNSKFKYWVATTKRGNGKKIFITDNVKLECSIYNRQMVLIESDTISIKNLIGQSITPVSEVIKDLQIDSEKIILLDFADLNYDLCISCVNISHEEKLLVKIKVLEIIPKINK